MVTASSTLNREYLNSRSSGVVWLVITPLVIAYQAGRGRFSGIARDFRTRRSLGLQCGDGLFEVEDFPNCDAEIEQSDAANRAAYPTRGNDLLQPLNARRARSI